MTTYLPYFYIIRDKRNNKLYAGSRWANGCNPSEFMKPDGYTTSSKTINNIIKECGIDTFEVLRIDTSCDGKHPYDYETEFLLERDCANSNEWYNEHNNDVKSAYGTPKFRNKVKQIFLERYNKETPLESKEVQDQCRETLKSRHGVANAGQLQSSRIKASARASVKGICPHCGTEGQKFGMVRYHFDNCKQNPKYIQKPKKEYECPHCGKVGHSQSMFRWHFDKCKFRKN